MRVLETLDVLIVDDHEPTRRIYAHALREAGVASVRDAASGADALERLGDYPAAVIVVDNRMPGGSGPEFIAAVRANPACAHARIVMATGSAEPDVAAAARAAGADAVVVKPLTPRALLQAIEAVLAEQRT